MDFHYADQRAADLKYFLIDKGCRSERRIVNTVQRLALRQKYPKLNIKRFDPDNMEEQD